MVPKCDVSGRTKSALTGFTQFCEQNLPNDFFTLMRYKKGDKKCAYLDNGVTCLLHIATILKVTKFDSHFQSTTAPQAQFLRYLGFF